MAFILASSSPRRKELFSHLGINFSIISPDIEEILDPQLTPAQQILNIAENKLDAVIDQNSEQDWILAADTAVVLDQHILGKAEDRNAAKQMLKQLSGKKHVVITAMALYNADKKIKSFRVVETIVHFVELSDEFIEWYLSTDEWKGVAGSYRIQGRGESFISEIIGPYSNVMGLPMNALFSMLHVQKYPFIG